MLKLSIIVPMYNVEPYIEKCIRSLYRQDIPMTDYEVVCVDDCSPDKSAQIVDKLQTGYSTLQLIRHERNKKLGGARNTGIRAAKGKYLLFVDSDDMLKPNCLKQLIDEIDSQQDDYIHFNLVQLFPEGHYGKEPHFDIDSQQRTGRHYVVAPVERERLQGSSRIGAFLYFVQNDQGPPWQKAAGSIVCGNLPRQVFSLQAAVEYGAGLGIQNEIKLNEAIVLLATKLLNNECLANLPRSLYKQALLVFRQFPFEQLVIELTL